MPDYMPVKKEKTSGFGIRKRMNDVFAIGDDLQRIVLRMSDLHDRLQKEKYYFFSA